MSNPAPQLVQELWRDCNILRDDGVSHGDYVEQLTFLLFLKMADEQSRPPFNKPSAVPKEFAWPSLLARAGRLPFLRAFTGELLTADSADDADRKENPSVKSA